MGEERQAPAGHDTVPLPEVGWEADRGISQMQAKLSGIALSVLRPCQDKKHKAPLIFQRGCV